MMLRTESDFVLAGNMSYDLASCVGNYLLMFREYVNGYNGINIPKQLFTVTFSPSTKEHCISVSLHWTDVRTWEETLYYDTDSDYFQESMGGDVNAYGSVTHSEDYPRSQSLTIPISHLMMNEANMKEYFINLKTKIIADKAEANRLTEITRLKNQLKELEK